jgi:hypothetical protein
MSSPNAREAAHGRFAAAARENAAAAREAHGDGRALARLGDVLTHRLATFDLYAAFIASPDTAPRRKMVRHIRALLERKYQRALANEHDRGFRDFFDRAFDIALGPESRFAHIAQMYIIHIAVLLEHEVALALCPPAPTVPGAVDGARVYRVGFVEFTQRDLYRTFLDFIDGTTMSVITFVLKLNGAYTDYMPAIVVDEVIAERNVRRIDFKDADARARVAHALERTHAHTH